MEVYVVYVMGDYAHALAVTTDLQTAEKYREELNKRVNRPTWVDIIEVNNQITELDCD